MPDSAEKKPGLLDKFLGAFSKVEAGEGGTVVLMMVNIFIVLIAYYIIKVAREPLVQGILETTTMLFGKERKVPGGAELKSYGSAVQAAVLMAYVPLYGWFSSKVKRMSLIVGVTIFFISNIVLFAIGIAADIPYIGFAFFIWVGIFSLSMIAQFWSYANDVYTKEQGDRLFPIIAIGMTAGPPTGSFLARQFFDTKVDDVNYTPILLTACVLLVVHIGLSLFINRRIVAEAKAANRGSEEEKLSGSGGFTLLFRSKYLGLIAALLFMLNIVNTNGEYILGASLGPLAAASGNPDAFYGTFYADFFLVVNVVALLVQAFAVSRLVKFAGTAGLVLLLPLISISAYALVGAGVGFAILRWAKTAENATDYSVMNTAKGILWLITSRDEKYKAKQAIDTFIVRLGDVASALVVGLGINVLHLSASGFGIANVGFALVWIAIGIALVRMHKRLSPPEPAKA